MSGSHQKNRRSKLASVGTKHAVVAFDMRLALCPLQLSDLFAIGERDLSPHVAAFYHRIPRLSNPHLPPTRRRRVNHYRASPQHALVESDDATKENPVRTRPNLLRAYRPFVSPSPDQPNPAVRWSPGEDGKPPGRMVDGDHYDDAFGTISSTHPARAGTALPRTRPSLTASSPSPHTPRSTDPFST